jgi:hypothetical protein
MDRVVPLNGALRPFGAAADLDLDFQHVERPRLVTRVLAQCGDPRDESFWWDQPVGHRTATLLRLVALTDERPGISLNARCASATCGETFGFELPLGGLPDGNPGTLALRVPLGADRVLTMRRPTGDDLRRWAQQKPASRQEAVRVMLESLVIDGDVGPADEAALSASMSAMDPLVDFTVSCACPACGLTQDVAVDLESLALASLARRQRALLREVHRLASRYGWTEADVLAVPPARRARYLALMEAEP